MKMTATILDDRYSGVAFCKHPPVVVPMLGRYKLMPWRRRALWGVVQPKREIVDGQLELVWRHIAVFTEEKDAREFLDKLA